MNSREDEGDLGEAAFLDYLGHRRNFARKSGVRGKDEGGERQGSMEGGSGVYNSAQGSFASGHTGVLTSNILILMAFSLPFLGEVPLSSRPAHVRLPPAPPARRPALEFTGNNRGSAPTVLRRVRGPCTHRLGRLSSASAHASSPSSPYRAIYPSRQLPIIQNKPELAPRASPTSKLPPPDRPRPDSLDVRSSQLVAAPAPRRHQRCRDINMLSRPTFVCYHFTSTQPRPVRTLKN